MLKLSFLRFIFFTISVIFLMFSTKILTYCTFNKWVSKESSKTGKGDFCGLTSLVIPKRLTPELLPGSLYCMT